jgi:hypothetical protein
MEEKRLTSVFPRYGERRERQDQAKLAEEKATDMISENAPYCVWKQPPTEHASALWAHISLQSIKLKLIAILGRKGNLSKPGKYHRSPRALGDRDSVPTNWHAVGLSEAVSVQEACMHPRVSGLFLITCIHITRTN